MKTKKLRPGDLITAKAGVYLTPCPISTSPSSINLGSEERILLIEKLKDKTPNKPEVWVGMIKGIQILIWEDAMSRDYGV